MTAQRSGTSKGRTSTPARHLPALPKGSNLSHFTSLPEASMRLGISDKTLLKWSVDQTHGCPPVYAVSPKKRLMRTTAVEKWVRSKRYQRNGGSDAQAC